MTQRLLLLLLTLSLLAACRQPAPDPFDRDPSGDDDDDDDAAPPEPGAWIEFRRINVHPSPTASALALATWFESSDEFLPRVPMPKVLDTCHGGVALDGAIGLPESTLDAGVTTLLLVDGTEVALDEQDDDGVWQAELSTEDWEPTQEYTVLVGGGEHVEAQNLAGQLGTPDVMVLDETPEWSEDGLVLEWYGANFNGEVYGTWISDLVTEGEDAGSRYWLGCRLDDDGEHVIDLDEFDALQGMEAHFELARLRTVDFQIEPDFFGSVVGSTVTIAEYVPPPSTGDDDDSALDDDDDSAR